MKKLLFILLFICSFAQAQTTIKPEGKQIHTSGTTVSASDGVGILKVNPASVLLTLTITFPNFSCWRSYIRYITYNSFGWYGNSLYL